jgi:hypothetical protein
MSMGGRASLSAQGQGPTTLVDVTQLLFAAAGLVVLGLVMWAGHRMVTEKRSGTSSGAGGALGAFSDVFDPARSRAEHDLDSKEHQGELLPAPLDADQPVHLDLDKGTARIRRP